VTDTDRIALGGIIAIFIGMIIQRLGSASGIALVLTAVLVIGGVASLGYAILEQF
jgi:hypothetical protein